MNVPENLKYTASHEWIEYLDNGRARVGITDFAQHSMGDIVYVRLPQPGEALVAGAAMADLESVKAVSEVFSPLTGTVAQVHSALEDAPEAINQDAYAAWMAEIEGITATAELLDAAGYRAVLAAEGE
ncbi:MAG: glycine cleavage system protein GcvH [Clostridiales bacterium]|nr:glycine cleavage system protein GcvH [Clostridiales bacterium]